MHTFFGVQIIDEVFSGRTYQIYECYVFDTVGPALSVNPLCQLDYFEMAQRLLGAGTRKLIILNIIAPLIL